MSTLARIWFWLRNSLWFVPALIVAGSSLTAVLLVEASGLAGANLGQHWPRVFGASAEGSRQILASIATSMITVAGVVFSITIVALSLASTQYSPRVLRNFMRDRPTQVVLGVFVGNFAYCLLVLRTVRGSDGGGDFIPSLAVLSGMVYAFFAIALLIYFIHHVAQSIQAASIVSRIQADASKSIDDMFPESLGAGAHEPDQPSPTLPQSWCEVKADRNGYVTAIAREPLLDFACDSGRVVRLSAGVGDFVMRDEVLFELSGDQPVTDEQIGQLRKFVTLDRQRTPEQDPGFALQQLVDVAVKALSPGINDPTTTCMCLDQLGTLVVQLSSRRMPDPYRVTDGQLRVIAPAPEYGPLVMLAFGTIVEHSRGEVQVLKRVLAQLRIAGKHVSDPRRRHVLAHVARAVWRKLGEGEPSAAAGLARLEARSLIAVLNRPL